MRRLHHTVVVVLIAIVAVGLLGGCTGSGTATKPQISANGTFDPNPVVVPSGQPLELQFGQGSGCTAAVAIPPLGVGLTDLTGGGATVKLGPLEPGTYPLICQANMVMGQLVVE